MYEAIRNLAVLVWAVSAINSPSYAGESLQILSEEAPPSSPTMVFGAARQSDGAIDEFTIEQPAGAPNPLGNPIPVAADDGLNDKKLLEVPQLSESDSSVKSQGEPRNLINEKSAFGTLQPGNVPLPQPAVGGSSQIENEMYEADGNIVDVQEYPLSDVGKMTRPIAPATLVNQPEMN